MLAACEQVGRRASEAANRGDATFAVPEASEVAAWVAKHATESPLRAEASDWTVAGASYHALVRLCARAVMSMDGAHEPFESRYRDKVQAELEPMLALWPHVLVWPTPASLTAQDMIRLRAFPVHPLGLVGGLAWTDGALAPPSEFFFHDLDHARFKVREDLRVEGIEIPDAYAHGTTIDSNTGRHRAILPFARGLIRDRLWAVATTRAALAGQLLASTIGLADRTLATAAELLLFEILHEKSFPLDRAALNRELANSAHLHKLREKADARFFPAGVDDAVASALPAARSFLITVVQ